MLGTPRSSSCDESYLLFDQGLGYNAGRLSLLSAAGSSMGAVYGDTYENGGDTKASPLEGGNVEASFAPDMK